MLASVRKIHCLALRDVLQKHNRISDASVGPNLQSLKVANLMRFGIANTRILSDRKFRSFRGGARPFDGAGDRSAVLDRYGGVVRLGGSSSDAEQQEQSGGYRESHGE